MSDLYTRLREAIATGRPAAAPAPTPQPADSDAARALGGVFVDHPPGRVLVIDREHRPHVRHGLVTLDEMPDCVTAWAALVRLLRAARPETLDERSILFVDLETTGLAGGAGTHAFLVGVGWFEDGAFRTRQFFLDRFAGEPAMLDAVAARVHDASVIASFNGKSFDLPLIDTRFLFHRRDPPDPGKPHLDLLHPSRRLWSGPDGCSLAVLEHQLFGVARGDDVPGVEIPGRYFAYIRGASPTTLAPVLAHNRSDLLSLAMIALYVGGLIDAGAGAARTAEECFGLGRLYEWLDEDARALACYERAARLAWRSPVRRLDALRSLARLYRRERRHEDARSAWEAIVDAVPGVPIAAEAATALAIHHEHRSKDLPRAKRFALRALDLASGARRAAVHHRLARIDRKIERTVCQPSMVFD